MMLTKPKKMKNIEEINWNSNIQNIKMYRYMVNIEKVPYFYVGFNATSTHYFKDKVMEEYIYHSKNTEKYIIGQRNRDWYGQSIRFKDETFAKRYFSYIRKITNKINSDFRKRDNIREERNSIGWTENAIIRNEKIKFNFKGKFSLKEKNVIIDKLFKLSKNYHYKGIKNTIPYLSGYWEDKSGKLRYLFNVENNLFIDRVSYNKNTYALIRNRSNSKKYVCLIYLHKAIKNINFNIDLKSYSMYDISGSGTPFDDNTFDKIKPLLLKNIQFQKEMCIPNWYKLIIPKQNFEKLKSK